MKMNNEAINEITKLLEDVKDVVKVLKDFGIHITSDSWSCTSFSEKENILSWKKEDFENITNINIGDRISIGGDIITGTYSKYNGMWVCAPKKLAIIQGEIFEKYLNNIIKSNQLKHFDLKLVDEYGIYNNDGWEHLLVIDAKIKESGLIQEKDYIDIEKINKLDNYRLMKESTELFMQLMYFYETERDCKNLTLKIGNFKYDDWYADIWCVLNENGVKFKHIRDYDKFEWNGNTLLEMYAFAWDFEMTEFNFNFKLINDLYKLLNEDEKELYSMCYDEVHCKLW